MPAAAAAGEETALAGTGSVGMVMQGLLPLVNCVAALHCTQVGMFPAELQEPSAALRVHVISGPTVKP